LKVRERLPTIQQRQRFNPWWSSETIVGIRISHGLPRGGLGYAGLASTLGAFVTAATTPPWIALLTTAVAVPLAIWCGLGLRRDSDDDEAYDLIVWTDTPDMDEDVWGWLLGKERTSIFRLSTVMFLGSVTALGIAVVRLLMG
jgi:hypothetical protein